MKVYWSGGTNIYIKTTFYLPGGSYLFTWPLVFSSVGLLVSLGLWEKTFTWDSAISAIPAFILFAPISHLVYIFMTIQMADVLLTLLRLRLL